MFAVVDIVAPLDNHATGACVVEDASLVDDAFRGLASVSATSRVRGCVDVPILTNRVRWLYSRLELAGRRRRRNDWHSEKAGTVDQADYESCCVGEGRDQTKVVCTNDLPDLH